MSNRWILARSCASPPDRSHSAVPPIVHKVLRSSGRPLDSDTRGFMESRFGHDFGSVRVHTDADAAASARAVHARAYTVGHDIVFSRDRFAPSTAAGKELLAHELAHTIQQRPHAGFSTKLNMSTPGDASEREADAASEAVMNGKSPEIASVGQATLSRQEEDEDEPIQAQAPDAGVPQQEEPAAPACPITKKGTLSQVSWGETGGLYPTENNLYKPDKWDQAKLCELLKARGAVHEVAKRGQKTHKGKPKAKDRIEQMLKVYHYTQNFPPLDSTISDPDVKWFYLSDGENTPATHPSKPDTVKVQTYGSFFNIGGGDAPRGPLFIHFYKKA